MSTGTMYHIAIIGEPTERCCRSYGGRITQNAAEVTCATCRESWAYAVAQRREAIPAGWMPVSVEPAANFGIGHGLLAVSESGQAGRVVIEQADPLVYILNDWVMQVFYGKIPWAALAAPFLRIHGTDRTVVYKDTGGGCGWRVKASIFEMAE